MRIFAHKQTDREQTIKQTLREHTENSKTEATLILCGSSGERANISGLAGYGLLAVMIAL